MTPERWQRIEDLFQSARTRTTAERAAFLDGACGGDTELRAEVEGLLAAEDSAGSFINTSAVKVAAGMIADERAAEMLGQTVAHYKILSPLGAGGMGEIYLAEDAELGRKVALKFLPDYALVDDDRVRRFRQEARVASALSHPNIAHIYEIGESEGASFIALEFIEGQTLAARIAGRPLGVEEIVAIATQVADALDEAHAHGITHRDIKAANIMLTPRGLVKVLDFGLAKMTQAGTVAAAPAGQAAQVETRTGMVMGTVNYMSPEQAMGRDVDTRTDIWSLGVVLYEMATGRLPFNGDSAPETIDRIAHAQPEAIARFNYDVPPDLEVIVKKALRKKREERYQTARDLLVDLKNLKEELELEGRMRHAIRPTASGELSNAREGGRTAGESPAADTTEVASAPPTTSAEYLIGEIKRHRVGATLVLAVALLTFGALAAGVYRLLRQRAVIAKPVVLSRPGRMKVTKLTESGNAACVNISPDGKYVAFSFRGDGGTVGFSIKQVATGMSLQIVAPAKRLCYGTTFSSAGDLLYYVARDEDDPAGALYQVPVIGGTPRKLLTDISSPVALSPDGRSIAYVYRDENLRVSDLRVAEVDGRGAHSLVSRKGSAWFSSRGPSWSPDGRVIACGAGTGEGERYQSLFGVHVEDAVVSQLTPQKWREVNRVAWLGDGSGIVMLTSERPGPFNQVWEVSYPDGEARKITNDVTDHGVFSLGVTADSSTIVTAESDYVCNIWVAKLGASMASDARRITAVGGRRDGRWGLAWTGDGRLVYTSRAGGTPELWVMNADGSGQRQLTSNPGAEQPDVSLDGRYAVFQSPGGDGIFHLWKINLDGGGLTQLTSGEDYDARISPDGEWVVYTSRGDRQTLWRVPIEGGSAAQLYAQNLTKPAISPDGKLIAGNYHDDALANPHWQIALIPLSGWPPVKVISLPPQASLQPSHDVQWTSDGRALVYVDTSGGVSNVWRQPIDGGPRMRLTDFKSELIFSFSISRDGKRLACARGANAGDVILIQDFR